MQPALFNLALCTGRFAQAFGPFDAGQAQTGK
jgi:hypothetical protein